MNEQEIQNLWDSFLSTWAIENVQKMTLEQYIQVGSKDTFTYWLEHTTRPIADIRGGDASKFGIFHRRDQQDKENGRGRIYDNEYCWFQKFGDTKEQAFQTIKENILNVINAITNNEFEKILNIPVSEMFKWKIAFLYQNKKKPLIISIFSKTILDFLTEDKKLNYVEAYQHLLRNKGEQSILSYSDQLVNEYFDANPKQSFLTPSEADEILNIKYPDQYISRQKMTVVTNSVGREIALVLTGSKANVFIECDPENNTTFNFKFCKKKDGSEAKYAENDTRHSNLNALSEHLKYGNKAYRIEIETADELENFCEWYELDTYQSIDNSNSEENKEMSNKIIQPLNRILFGAAGTGKTFNTINHALSIIENKSLEILQKEEREDLKNRFDEYKNKGQIKFVTFHQSFSYEDFVEGIRAESDEDGNLTYLVKDGIFKEISIDAQIEIATIEIQENVPTEQSITNAIGRLIERAKQTELVFYTKRNAEIKVISNSSGTLFALNSKDSTIPLSIRHIQNYLKTQQENIVDNRAYEWAIAKSLRPEVEYDKTKLDSKPYVLIIDEVNRGNISRIFGELITLIEDSKRAGADEELSVTLPYSKQEFTVPNNVYIIGTMNSSDRSLTGLDIALRRRFTFIEMPPQPNLLKDVSVEGINIERLLTVINQRIEILLDRDHCLGHANFMSLEQQPTLDNLSNIFKQKVIPQLQEYFFDDWAKINLVLNGNGMLQSKSIEKSVIFPNVDFEELGYFEDKKAWELVPTSFNKIESFAKIIQH
ncbi:McrB family protein [Acinetobacter ursingii]|uniref:AAA family ATPase n=1 Tax=Acinetobacter ursingii TaxID=108980 RepID=A0AA46S4Z4_9GAMM|nr:AAA family ATPase [Acinetobacter ursingii]UYF73349.1 AAA family ATPase [Acinetobacter ursingii]